MDFAPFFSKDIFLQFLLQDYFLHDSRNSSPKHGKEFNYLKKNTFFLVNNNDTLSTTTLRNMETSAEILSESQVFVEYEYSQNYFHFSRKPQNTGHDQGKMAPENWVSQQVKALTLRLAA